jgi:Cu(I)/Ag(I) efflux system membrane fusion protein
MTDEEMKAMDNEKTDVSFSNEIDNNFKTQLGTFVNTYLKMKDAFVATDEKLVVSEAKKLLAALDKIDMGLLKGDAHNEWMKLLKPIKDNVNGIVSMKGIEMKRSHFSIVSNKLTEAIEKFGISSPTPMYLEYCPMAFDDKGAFWISNQKEIRNPYFGDMMLKCGEVKKEFNR